MHGEEFKVKLVSMGLCVDGGKDTSHKRRWEIEWFNFYLFMFGMLLLLLDTTLLMIEKGAGF